MVNPYLLVLKAPDVPRVFAAALLGRLSTAMGPLALVLYVQAATGSFAVAGAAAAATGTSAAAAQAAIASVRRTLIPGDT
jgi:hypothetical protein